MKKNITIVGVIVVLALIAVNIFQNNITYNVKLEKLKQKYSKKLVPSVDHSKLEVLNRKFKTPQEVTEECLMCHDEAGDEILATRHWNWLGSNLEDTTIVVENRGKKNLINNFCIAVPSNYPRCTSCHISYGWKDNSFDFSSPENIDCLVCHEQTGTYIKIPEDQIIYISEGMEDILGDVDNLDYYWEGDMAGKSWIMTENGLELHKN